MPKYAREAASGRFSVLNKENGTDYTLDNIMTSQENVL